MINLSLSHCLQCKANLSLSTCIFVFVALFIVLGSGSANLVSSDTNLVSINTQEKMSSDTDLVSIDTGVLISYIVRFNEINQLVINRFNWL